MSLNGSGLHRRRVPATALVPFVVITFGLAWGILVLCVVLEEQVTALFGPVSGRHPLFLLAVYAPAIAGFVLVAVYTGADGLRRYLRRLLLWRCPAVWYGFLLLGIPLIFASGAALKGNLLPYVVPFPSVPALLGALGITMVVGPVEEFGWRGLALPLLQRRFAPLWAGLLVGLFWGLWHLPAFLLNGTPQSAWSFTPFLMGSLAVSVILTPMFNASRGSILLSALFHFQLNNPLWPDAQPHDSVVFAAAALLVVWLNRDTMFRRGEAVTEVVPP